jgi:hypothetical protein
VLRLGEFAADPDAELSYTGPTVAQSPPTITQRLPANRRKMIALTIPRRSPAAGAVVGPSLKYERHRAALSEPGTDDRCGACLPAAWVTDGSRT